MLENTETIEGILISLHRSVWSIGSAAFVAIGVSARRNHPPGVG
jgi:hypothetical protein